MKRLRQFTGCFLACLSLLASQMSAQDSVSVAVTIFDEKGQPTAARVRFTSSDGAYLAPEGHLADFAITSAQTPEGEEADVVMDENRRFAYVEGKFSIELPREPVRIEVVKGYRYRIYDETLDLSQKSEGLEIHLEKAFDLPDADWYSGDVHVHFLNPKSAMLELKGEDLNVCNVLISDFTVDHERFRGDIEPISEPEHLLFFGQEYRENRLGHVDLLNLKENLIEPAKTMREHQYPLNLSASEEVRNQGGHISWAHFAAWPGLEGPLGLVLKKVDSVELLCTMDPFHEPIFVSDVVPEVQMNSGLRLWYRLLNCGLRIPATAGTDKMNNQVTVGANRVFARVDGAFTYDNWIEALNQGRTFVSNSPFMLFSVNEQEPGAEISGTLGQNYQLHAEVWSQMPIDRLEIIVNGELVAETSIARGETHATLSIPYRPTESVWIAARAYQFSLTDARKGLSMAQRRDAGGGPTELNRYFGTLRPETTFAHTSPVYLKIDGQPVRSKMDADYFVHYLENARRWLDESGSFPSDTAKAEVLAAFEEGKRAFEDLKK
jgi:hypothetical protein